MNVVKSAIHRILRSEFPDHSEAQLQSAVDFTRSMMRGQSIIVRSGLNLLTVITPLFFVNSYLAGITTRKFPLNLLKRFVVGTGALYLLDENQ